MNRAKQQLIAKEKPASLFDRTTVLVFSVYLGLNCFLILLGQGGGMLRQLFIATSALTGLFLYRYNGPAYASFTLWLWFLTPLVRRYIDYRIGWSDPNIVLLVPYIVTLISLLAVKDIFSPALRKFLLPSALMTVALLSGIVVGLFRMSPKEVATGTIAWVAPMAFAFYLITKSSQDQTYRRAMINTIAAGGIVMSAYGLYQFITAPPWDSYWLVNVTPDLVAPSFGHPEPFGYRTWSTLNSPGTLSGALAMAILVLLSRKTWMALPAVMGLLITQVRTAWVALALGLVISLFVGPPEAATKLRRRVLVLVIMFVAGAVLITAIPTMGDRVSDRFSSFVNLKKDESLHDRTFTYETVFLYSAGHPLGDGISNSTTIGDLAVDGLIQSLLISLGWFGTAVFLAGFGRMVYLLFSVAPKDADVSVLKVGALMLISMAPASNVVYGPTGIFTWMLTGLALAPLGEVVAAKEKSGRIWYRRMDLASPVGATAR